jgi:hypothetical protein
MITVLSSPKPGSGTTTTAALLALTAASDQPTVLVDLVGDQAPLMAITPAGRISIVTNCLELVHAEALSLGEQTNVIAANKSPEYHVVIDAGRADNPIHEHLPAGATVTWVLRPCYLALRRAVAATTRPDQIVLVSELGRALTPVDVEHILGAPVVASIEIHPEIARATDAGLLVGGPPRRAIRALRPLIDPNREAA